MDEWMMDTDGPWSLSIFRLLLKTQVFPKVLKPKHSFCIRKECVNGRVDGLTSEPWNFFVCSSAAEELRSQAFTLVKQDELSLKVRDLSGPVSCGDSPRVSAS